MDFFAKLGFLLKSDFLVVQPEMKKVAVSHWVWFSTKWNCSSETIRLVFYKVKKQRSCLRLRKDVSCVSIDSFRFRWQKSLVKEDWLNLLGGSVVIWELLMIQYQAFLGAPRTSAPGKQLVGRTPSCLCFAFLASSHTATYYWQPTFRWTLSSWHSSAALCPQ